MANETSNSDIRPTHNNSLGMFLKSKREEKGLEEQEVATQLRLRLKVIAMMESDSYPEDLPITYIRGYIRSYGKLLEIPEQELKQAMEFLQPSPPETHPEPEPVIIPTIPKAHPIYFRKIFLISLFFTLLIAMIWWIYPKEPTQPININMNSELSENLTNNPTSNLKPVVLVPQQMIAKHNTHKNFHIPGFSTFVFGKHLTMQFFAHFLLFLLIGLTGLWIYYYKTFTGLKTKSDNIQDESTYLPNKAAHLFKLRVFTSLIIFLIASLASLWWGSYLLSLAPAMLAKKEPPKYTLPPQPLIFANHEETATSTPPPSAANPSEKETTADAKSKSAMVHKFKLKMHAKNKMKQIIAPSSVDQYTPDDESEKQVTSNNETNEMN